MHEKIRLANEKRWRVRYFSGINRQVRKGRVFLDMTLSNLFFHQQIEEGAGQMKRARAFIPLIIIFIIMGTIRPAMADHKYDVIRPAIGGVLGAVLGSVIGNNIGKGRTTKRVATGLGAALGLMAGREFARYEHSRQMPHEVSVPHALHVPPLRIQQNTMALTCKVVDHSARVYACRDQSGTWKILQ